MKIREGGIYTLEEDYAHTNNFFLDKSTVVAISDGTDDGFFTGVQVGNFKNLKNDKNRIIVEMNYEERKYFSVVSCEELFRIPIIAVKSEISVLDSITVKAIKYQVLTYEKKEGGNTQKKNIHRDTVEKQELTYEEALKIIESQKNSITINQEEFDNIKKVLLDSNTIISFVKDMADENNARKKRKLIRWIRWIITLLLSFFSGVFASYCANHWDNGITEVIDNIYKFIDYIFSYFL